VYYQLTEALKRRFILELRRMWAPHPKYPDLVGNIQGKYTFKERPQYAIIVKTSGATKVELAADNFIGTIHSYAYLARVDAFPGQSIEWIRENALAIRANGGRFPSPPGIYYIEITEYDVERGVGEFWVDKLLEVWNEPVTMASSTEGRLQRIPLPGTLNLYEAPGGTLLHEGGAYDYDADTGTITLKQPLGKGLSLSADYRFPGVSQGPYDFRDLHANVQAVPGVVLAFGRMASKGDRSAVVVGRRRSPVAHEYGGKWEVSLDFDVVSRDQYSQMEISDRTITWLYGVLRPQISGEGIEIIDVSFGGEAEEVYDETGDDYFYNASFSATVQTDWSIHVPMGPAFRSVDGASADQLRKVELEPGTDQSGSVQQAVSSALGLHPVRDPFFSGRSATFEVIR
jgi:hypothetical protein